MTVDIRRTPDEIVTRIHNITRARDQHGEERSALLEALPFEMAMSREFMRDPSKHTQETWKKNRPKTEDDVLVTIVGHLPYAWSRANGKHATSALRIIALLRGHLWLLKQDDLVEDLLPENSELVFNQHPFYGKLALVQISESVGFNWRDRDNGKWYSGLSAAELTAEQAMEDSVEIDD